MVHICVWLGSTPATRMIDISWPIYVCVGGAPTTRLIMVHMCVFGSTHVARMANMLLALMNMDKYSGNYQFVKLNLHQS